MATALSGHVSRECQHAHAEPWAWHPSIRLIRCADINNWNSLHMELKLKPPVVQIALDFATIEEALAVARIGVEAGVDWLEIGTPLIVSQGLRPISEMVKAFPNYPVLADYKTMDSGGKNVHRTKAQGGHIMTVCANAPDETVKAAVAASKETDVM